jgi:hypothetical protein
LRRPQGLQDAPAAHADRCLSVPSATNQLGPALAAPAAAGRRDWPEYCLFILAWFPPIPSLQLLPLTWPHNALRAASQGHFVFCSYPFGPQASRPAPRAVVLHHSHTSYPLYAGAGHCRSFDKMPSRTSLARQGSLCCRGSENQKGDRFGESPISGLLAKPVVAIFNQSGGFPHGCCAVNNRPRNNDSACMAP